MDGRPVHLGQDATSLLRTFLDVSLVLTQQFDATHVLTTIVERSMTIARARYGAAATVDSSGRFDRFIHRGLRPEEIALLPHLPEGKGLLGEVLATRAALRLDNLADHPASIGFPTDHVAMHAFLGVPMLFRGDLVGALYLSKGPGDEPFTDIDQEMIQAMSSMAALAIENARLFASESERAKRSVLMRDINRRIRTSLDMNEVLASGVEELGRAAGADGCFIRLVADGKLQPISFSWDTGDSGPRNDTATMQTAERAVETKQTQWVNASGEGDEAEASLAAPLLWGESILGVVAFRAGGGREWSADDIELIEDAAEEVATGLHHARLYGESVHASNRLQELDILRSDFVAMVSHEVRAPATVLRGIADLLMRHDDQLDIERRNELLGILSRESERLTRLVSEILDIEAIDHAEDFTLSRGFVDIAELVREAVADSGLVERVGIAETVGDTTVECDRTKIKQVLLNLLANAGKFSPSTSRIELRVTTQESSVTVAIRDAGAGIPEEHLGKLFQRFVTVPVPGQSLSGSGLGLYLSRRIIERHGGAIWADSKPGEGATFSFRLPRTPPS